MGLNLKFIYNRFSRDQARKDHRRTPLMEWRKKHHNLMVAVIASDVGHKSSARACMLAEALSRSFHVMLLWLSCRLNVNQILKLHTNDPLEVLPLPCGNFPELLNTFDKAAQRIEADIILVCGLRLPAVQLGLMMKAFKNRPLFIDIADDDHSLFKEKSLIALSDIRETKRYSDLAQPFGETWTRFAESLFCHADGIFVSSPALKKKFGGIFIPHAREDGSSGPCNDTEITEKLSSTMLDTLDHPKPLARDALAFIQIQKGLFSGKQNNQGGSASKEIDIVMFWKQNDTGLYGRRSDMLIKYLARRQQIGKIAVFDMPLSIPALRDKARQTGINHDPLIYRETLLRNWGVRDSDKISFHTFIYHTGKNDTDKQVWHFPDKSGYLPFIEARVQEAGIRPGNAVFWFYPENSYITKIAKRFRPRLKVVDLVDDHRTWPKPSGRRWFDQIKYYIKRLYLTKHYKEVLKTADVVFANCQNVKQAMEAYHQGIRLIPNGCELAPLPDLSRDHRFQRFESASGPKLGYVGNLEKGKVDRDLIEYLAKRRPDWQIFLIGSTHANPEILELDEYSNIHFMGVIHYPDVRAWIKAFDVAILPHLNSEKTRSMNPLKLYVYCSLGVPVVATDIENLDELKPFISIAHSHEDFLKKVEQSLESGDKKISKSMQLCLEKNTWDRRVDQILDEINAVL